MSEKGGMNKYIEFSSFSLHWLLGGGLWHTCRDTQSWVCCIPSGYENLYLMNNLNNCDLVLLSSPICHGLIVSELVTYF